MSLSVSRQLVVFDFDWSLVDQDTDRYVFEVLSPALRRKLKDLKSSVQWTDLVALCLEDLHSQGFTRQQIEHALQILPFHPAMIRAVTGLKAATHVDTTFFCLSNSNAVFISTILNHKGLQNQFDEIVTNPAEWDASGLLKLRRRVDPTGPQHKCQVGCSPNMCKGDELDDFLKRRGPDYERITYIGDGSNDFCPILRLRSQDYAFVRRGRGLEERIQKEGEAKGLKVQLRYWGGAWEVEELFTKLLH
ncbi:hypothetical protein SISNIDRAFT_478376 [Sistotremastrum niveocremeum HHB9708]|uniref:Phosphatase phospho-type n=1 Tax=Sistotremastrum niveocremeum HHB9708 TaxID=1314777 RepID=A0A164V9S5_9AGAM|nr:hypothetical protein SISNIDRAFT_478376 [Sistotremastrum niveocremeum HHB9708]